LAKSALAEFGAPLEGIAAEDFTDRNSFFRFGREPKGFDILPAIPGVDFDAAWQRRVETVVDAPTGLKAAFPCFFRNLLVHALAHVAKGFCET
jgi:hypothetical protein